MGVKEEYHNKGIGKKLLTKLEEEIKQNKIKTIQVYTLSDIVDYKPYDKTRRFYYNNGFIEYKRIKTDNPNCPEELFLRKDIND